MLETSVNWQIEPLLSPTSAHNRKKLADSLENSDLLPVFQLGLRREISGAIRLKLSLASRLWQPFKRNIQPHTQILQTIPSTLPIVPFTVGKEIWFICFHVDLMEAQMVSVPRYDRSSTIIVDVSYRRLHLHLMPVEFLKARGNPPYILFSFETNHIASMKKDGGVRTVDMGVHFV